MPERAAQPSDDEWRVALAQPEAAGPWRGAMSLPRELALRRHGATWRLVQRPVREIETLARRCDARRSSEHRDVRRACRADRDHHIGRRSRGGDRLRLGAVRRPRPRQRSPRGDARGHRSRRPAACSSIVDAAGPSLSTARSHRATRHRQDRRVRSGCASCSTGRQWKCSQTPAVLCSRRGSFRPERRVSFAPSSREAMRRSRLRAGS